MTSLRLSARSLAACVSSAALIAVSALALAQPTGTSPLAPPPNGPRRGDPAFHALAHATVHTAPGAVLKDATVVVRDGRIEGVIDHGADGTGQPGAIPVGARVWDCAGLHIYPGFIDAYVEVDAPRPDRTAPGVHWNTRVTPQRSALDGGLDERTAESLRKLGFAAGAISPKGGIFRGTSAVISLAKPAGAASADRPPVYLGTAYQSVAFDTSPVGGGPGPGGRGEGAGGDVELWSSYPNSQMGAIALVRQTLLDADWQSAARASGSQIASNALDALPSGGLMVGAVAAKEGFTGALDASPMGTAGAPFLFNADDELEALRAAKIAREFNRTAILLGSGTEFRRLAAIAKDGLPIVLPLNFPKAPDVSSIGKAEGVDLRDLMTWEQAPTNPRRLDAAGVKVALTTAKLKDRAKFTEHLKAALEHGLSEDRALAMLTTQPAEILGVADELGTIEKGKRANLVVADGPLFVVKPKASAKGEGASDDPAPDPDAETPGEVKPEPTPDDAPKDEPTPEKKSDSKETPKEAKVRDVWIDGVRHEVSPAPETGFVGQWAVTEADGKALDPAAADALKLSIDKDNAVTVTQGDKTVKAKHVRVSENRIDFTMDGKKLGLGDGVLTDHAVLEGDAIHGVSLMPDGSRHRYTATRQAAKPTTPGADGEKPAPPPPPAKANPVPSDPVPPTETESAPPGKGTAAQVAPPPESQTNPPADPAKPDAGQPDPATPGADSAKKTDEAPDDEPTPDPAVPETYGSPFGPYSVMAIPPQEAVLLTGATVWTCGPQGVIEDGWVFIDHGRISAVGEGGPPSTVGEVRVIDCAGKHLTPGLIDCHSHTGISGGVNESGQAVTAEVRIQDVTNPDAINWYRQLAGGITTVNSLHGSANPIGGQNRVNKARWGVAHPDEMHFEGAKPGIKFALGENVKQSNWGAGPTSRYPATRMGVETIIRDRFTAAGEYARARSGGVTEWPSGHGADAARAASSRPAPRRDLELEALAEILGGTRLVHCHSYRQDEILMLARMAKELGFTIGTFQHVLEGYKVADAIKESALGGSCFSDWWNYKVEVQDAIPYAGAIMHDAGVVVSFNSDSDELARRMNVEAAKAVKYGGLPPEEALKFVTLNPAIQLAIADRVGSLEPGKDADVVVWSGPPLSSLSRCEATYVDGRRYFSLEDDAAHRETIRQERSRLIQKLLASKDQPAGRAGERGGRGGRGGADRPTAPPTEEAARVRDHFMELLRQGEDLDAAQCGDCGMLLLELSGQREGHGH